MQKNSIEHPKKCSCLVTKIDFNNSWINCKIHIKVSRKDAELAEAQNFKRIQAHKSGPYDFENIQFGQVSTTLKELGI